MVDLHCHILSGIDDGAKNTVDALALIKEQQNQGIDKIVFTPHFNIDNIPLEEFLNKRAHALVNLKEYAKQCNYTLPQLKCAAEVYLTPHILDCELNKLCIEGTDYILIELPTDYYRQWTEDVLYRLRLEGVTPILAHIERYSYFEEIPEKLYTLANSGVIMQVNAGSLMRKKQMQSLVKLYMKHNLVHILASDTHSLSKRPPMLKQAFDYLEKSKYSASVSTLKSNAEDIFEGEEIDMPYPTKINKIFGRLV